MWEFQRAHRNYDLDVAMTALVDDDFEQIDHRPMGYAPMGKSEIIALYRTGLDDPTLRAVPVYSVVHQAFDGGCLAAGMLWMRGTSDDYWNGQPFLIVLEAAQGQLVSGDLYPGDDLDAAMARFHELDAAARADSTWNRADRVCRNAARRCSTGAWPRPVSPTTCHRRSAPLLAHTYVGRDESSKVGGRPARFDHGRSSSTRSPSGARTLVL